MSDTGNLSSEDELPLPRAASSHTDYSLPLRKRSRGSYASTSSDPPYFSSDDLAEASVDNYTSPRRKKQHRRTWYEDEAPTSMRHDALRRASKRAKDSGVFMSSDSNSSTSEEGFNIQPLQTKQKQKPVGKTAFANKPPVPPFPKAIPHGDRHVRKTIERCLEDDNEVVDLAHCNLASLSEETIQPLQHLTKRPKIHSSQTDEAYEPLAPALQVFLSSNLLRTIPSALLNLEYLKVLSLRNNRLTSLPLPWHRLRNLVELNVAGNQLKWLPYELIGLINDGIGKLSRLNVLPNPFFRPFPLRSGSFKFWDEPNAGRVNLARSKFPCRLQTSAKFDSDDENDRMMQDWLRSTYAMYSERSVLLDTTHNIDEIMRAGFGPFTVAISPLTYLDFDGTAPRSTPPPPSSLVAETSYLPAAYKQYTMPPRDCRQPSVDCIPSLFEICLRDAADKLILSDLERSLPQDIPENITIALKAAHTVATGGGSRCNVCLQRYVIPRAEWIEYIHRPADDVTCGEDELWLPYLRRSCSWQCAENAYRDNGHLVEGS